MQLPEVARNRDFMRLWVAQAISQTAQTVVNFAVLVLIEEISQRSLLVSLAILAFSLPAVLVGAIAGAIVDRTNKTHMMLITNILRALVVGSFFLIRLNGPLGNSLVAVYVLTIIFSIVGQFFGPAEAATIPSLVPREQLLSANAFFSATFNGSVAVGFAILGPLLVRVLGLDQLWLVVAGAFLVCALLVAGLPSGTSRRTRAGTTILPEGLLDAVREGWDYLRKNPRLRRATAISSIAVSVLLMIASLGPGVASRVLGLNTQDVSIIMIPAGLGMGLGVIFVGRAAKLIGKDRLVTISLASAGVLLMLLAGARVLGERLILLFGGSVSGGEATNLVVSIAVICALGLGVSNTWVTISANTVLQEESAEEVRGRVFAMLFSVTNLISALPVLFAGALADLIGLVPILFLIGLIMASLSTFFLLQIKREPASRSGELEKRTVKLLPAPKKEHFPPPP
ncbi:MAG: MFS transporter [Chloroflexi bacterium]|nr:MFS transporter [Chloroflexota bacterium]